MRRCNPPARSYSSHFGTDYIIDFALLSGLPKKHSRFWWLLRVTMRKSQWCTRQSTRLRRTYMCMVPTRFRWFACMPSACAGLFSECRRWYVPTQSTPWNMVLCTSSGCNKVGRNRVWLKVRNHGNCCDCWCCFLVAVVVITVYMFVLLGCRRCDCCGCFHVAVVAITVYLFVLLALRFCFYFGCRRCDCCRLHQVDGTPQSGRKFKRSGQNYSFAKTCKPIWTWWTIYRLPRSRYQLLITFLPMWRNIFRFDLASVLRLC
jgi:hypothetical protein